MRLIDQANSIIEEYEAAGYTLTLRQLYYQFVARDLFANKIQNYNRLKSIVNDARLAGLVSWKAIEDRTRYLRARNHYKGPADYMDPDRYGYAIDRWASQEYRPEVWIEKDALVGVIEGACERWDVPFFSCRGYPSASEVWRAAMRHLTWFKAGQQPVIIHLGDHDPSGVDMTRDLRDRLTMFYDRHGGGDVDVRRIALNWDQIEEYSPPPNPAKMTDSRVADYLANFGDESWELDALEPRTLDGLIEDEIRGLIDQEPWDAAEAQEQDETAQLELVRDRFQDAVDHLRNGGPGKKTRKKRPGRDQT